MSVGTTQPPDLKLGLWAGWSPAAPQPRKATIRDHLYLHPTRPWQVRVRYLPSRFRYVAWVRPLDHHDRPGAACETPPAWRSVLGLHFTLEDAEGAGRDAVNVICGSGGRRVCCPNDIEQARRENRT